MAGRNDYIASIDIGTDKIAILLAEIEDNDRLYDDSEYLRRLFFCLYPRNCKCFIV